MDLSKKIKEIRKFARYGLIEISVHCRNRAKERGISQTQIYDMLSNPSSSICQYHKTYKNHKCPTYVVWAKLNKKYYHIVIGESRTALDAPLFVILTVYEPSSQFFDAKGRFLKPLKRRI